MKIEFDSEKALDYFVSMLEKARSDRGQRGQLKMMERIDNNIFEEAKK